MLNLDVSIFLLNVCVNFFEITSCWVPNKFSNHDKLYALIIYIVFLIHFVFLTNVCTRACTFFLNILSPNTEIKLICKKSETLQKQIVLVLLKYKLTLPNQ